MRLADPSFSSEDSVELMVEFVIGPFRNVEDKLEEVEAYLYEKLKQDGK